MERTNDFDRLMQLVMAQAKDAGIPYSTRIDPHIRINTRAKKRFGQCVCRSGYYTIELSSVLLNAPERACRQTIAHELIHTCPGCGNHGQLFKKYASIMNTRYGYAISRTNTSEEMGLSENPAAAEAKYILECSGCGARITRMRLTHVVAYPSRYRCRCGGELVRIK